MSLKQSSSFTYRGLEFRRNQISHTQCTYSVYSKTGELLAGEFDALAPYNREAMVHVCRDGRHNEWTATDREIIESFEQFVSSGEKFGYSGLLKRVNKFITDKSLV